MNTTRSILLLLAILSTQITHAADACSTFKWDVSREIALFRKAPATIDAGAKTDSAPRIEAERAYEARLLAQPSVTLASPPSKKMLDDGAHAGLFTFRVSASGMYRVSIDAGFWVDVIAAGKPLVSTDFNGETACKAPRKIVVYELPADTDLILQFSAADTDRTLFAITKVATTAP
jgi:hypothetical protein